VRRQAAALSRATTAPTWRPHRVVVRHRLAGHARRPRRPRLPGHLLPQPHRAGRRPAGPLRAAPPAVRACGGDRPGRAAPSARPAHRPLERRARADGRRLRMPCGDADIRVAIGRWPASATPTRLRLPGRCRARGRHLAGPALRPPAPAAAGRRRLLAQGPGAESQASHYYSEPQLAARRPPAPGRPRAAAAAGWTTSGATRSWPPARWAGTGSASTCSTAAR
jgi:hypothetical protein